MVGFRALGASEGPHRAVLFDGDPGDDGRRRPLDGHRLVGAGRGGPVELGFIRPGRTIAPPATAATGSPGSDLPQAAAAWLQAHRTLRHDEPVDAWMDRMRPVVTPALAATYEHGRAAGPGLDWQQWVAQRCDAAVEDAVAIVPAEAPRTSDEVNVQVSGTLRTSCARTDPRPGQPAPGDEALAATPVVDRGADRLWRVSSRLF
jgi:hypothetical protein